MRTLTQETLRFYWKQIRKEKLLLFLCVFGVSLGVSSNLALFYVVKDLIDAMNAGLDFSLWYFIGLFAICEILNLIGWRLGAYSLSVLEPRVMASAGEDCFQAIHQHSYDFFNNEYVGALVKRVVRMVRSIENFLDLVIFDFFHNFLRLIFGIATLWLVHPWLGIALLTWTVLFIGFNIKSSLYKMRKYDIPAIKADSAVSAHLADTLTNNVNLKLFASFGFEFGRFQQIIHDWRKKQTKSWVFNQHMELVQNLLVVTFILIILALAIHLWQGDNITIGEFVLIQGYFFEIIILIWDFGRQVRRLYESLADAGEMTEILLHPVSIQDDPKASEFEIHHGKIQFKSVHFAYQDGDDAVLKNFNLTIKPGEKVAFIGPSGGGKTTIIKLLLRLFDIDQGEILIDGQNISQVKQDSLRQHIALVPQDPMLFHRSLMENIRYGRQEASDEEVLAAAKLARCHDFITDFPKGYDTHVGERGVKLSGGERQRIAIARAILSNARILILDEATSNLDVHSEQLIQEALKELIKNKTSLFIAHRLSTILHVDRIIAIENGRVVEQGSPTELLQKDGGLFQSLWKLNREGMKGW